MKTCKHCKRSAYWSEVRKEWIHYHSLNPFCDGSHKRVKP